MISPTKFAMAFLLLAHVAGAQPASDLLQIGIYNQETLGDLDGAIRIYRQILSLGAPQRLYAAQAQFRLGTCLLRKGDRAGAATAFQNVIRDYPGERDLVARAKESLPGNNDLLPAPWSPTEVSEYRWSIPFVDDGWSITRIAAASKGSPNLRIQMNFYSPRLTITRVDVDRDSMQPVQAAWRGPENAPNPDGTRHIRMSAGDLGKGTAFAFGELLYLLRRMPLTPGWRSTIPVILPDLTNTRLDVQVLGDETVVVPAGVFLCHKLRVTLAASSPRFNLVGSDWPAGTGGEILWYSVEGARALVKMQSGTATGELASLRTKDPAGSSSYHDPQAGYSFTIPAGWVSHSRASFNSTGSSVDLIDPESQVSVVVSGKTNKPSRGGIAMDLANGAAQRFAELKERRPKDFRLRAPVAITQVGGRDAVYFIADYSENGYPRVDYITWVQSANTRASITVQVDAADFDAFRARFQPLLDSFRMP